ncbi:hypothetical protein GCM10007159_15060 [Modicisalibacter luteus]|nr:hypothetical protein GCM10007159_15060 [Halomonas lutea]
MASSDQTLLDEVLLIGIVFQHADMHWVWHVFLLTGCGQLLIEYGQSRRDCDKGSQFDDERPKYNHYVRHLGGT